MPANNSMLKYTLIRLRRNYLAVLGFIVLFVLIGSAIFAERISPCSTSTGRSNS